MMVCKSSRLAKLHDYRRSTALALGAAILCIASLAAAAPRFISSGQVHKGAVYAEVTLEFRCKIHYVDHDPEAKSDVLRIRLEPTTICAGAPPTVALTREQMRPPGAEDAWLDNVEYSGEAPGNEFLILTFTEEVRFNVQPVDASDSISIRVFGPAIDTVLNQPATSAPHAGVSREVDRSVAAPQFVVNLQSSERQPATADLPTVALPDGTSLFVAEAEIEGRKWYRVQVGYFTSSEDAARALRDFREQYPSAWIGRAGDELMISELDPVAETSPATADAPLAPAQSDDEIAELMEEARRAMIAGELSKAVQMYTKVLQQQPNKYQPQAQEFLALARERNGQIAHAKAEYERYLEVYPYEEGAERVRQRLSALLATSQDAAVATVSGAAPGSARTAREPNPWSFRTFASQYYRRDVNQVNDQDEIVNQSSIYTDVSLDARRRGERFDIATRITAGYRSDLLDEEDRGNKGNDFRLSYAYLDVTDARTQLRGRLGRQTRNTGGVLGRFDGLNMTYTLNEQLRFDAVAGEPVYSTSTDYYDSRFFYGLSGTWSPFGNALEVGTFLLQQDIEGLTDRRAIGAELRYFGEGSSVWGILSYDSKFGELGSAFLQGSLRLPGNFTVTGLLDVRRSPFLSLGNALVGQQVESFEDMTVLFTEDELRQFALDRSPRVATVSTGLSKPLSPKLQFNLNASLSSVEASPESAGVPASDESEYSYYSADLVASSLFTEGDVGIIGLRYAVSNSTDVYSINLDSRFPIGRAWRINPRLRVDYREIRSDQSTQWIYTPALRIQFRPGRHWRVDLEAGKRFSRRDMALTDQDRESNFIYIGYQFFY
jgi:tetratricopeptide (TPR) repeat protein